MIVCCFLPVPGPLCFCLRLCLRCVLRRPPRAGSPLVIDTRLAQSPVIGTGGGCKHWLEGGNEALTLSSVSGSSGGGCLCLSSSFHLSTFQRTPLAKLYSCYLDSGTTGFSLFFLLFFFCSLTDMRSHVLSSFDSQHQANGSRFAQMMVLYEGEVWQSWSWFRRYINVLLRVYFKQFTASKPLSLDYVFDLLCYDLKITISSFSKLSHILINTWYVLIFPWYKTASHYVQCAHMFPVIFCDIYHTVHL